MARKIEGLKEEIEGLLKKKFNEDGTLLIDFTDVKKLMIAGRALEMNFLDIIGDTLESIGRNISFLEGEIWEKKEEICP